MFSQRLGGIVFYLKSFLLVGGLERDPAFPKCSTIASYTKTILISGVAGDDFSLRGSIYFSRWFYVAGNVGQSVGLVSR